MNKNIKNHHARQIISILIVLCMIMAFAPVTVFAEDTVYNHTYHTKVKLTANVTVQDSDGNTVNTYNVSEEGDFVEGNVSDDAVQAEITRLEAVVKSQLPSGAVQAHRSTSITFDHFESSYILIGDGGGESSTSTLDVHEYQIYEITDEWTVKPATQKEIKLIEINNATVSFKAGEEPVFTGTTPDGAPYVLDYECWFGADGKFICSSDYWNSAYVERDWCDGLVSSFKANTEYTYGLYVKLTDEAAARGYVFGPNTKLEVNGKAVECQQSGETGIAVQIRTQLTMTPALDDAPDYKIVEGANGTWTQNTDETLVFRANGDFSKFTDVLVDDELVDEKNYTAVSGSTIVTLKADYLNTLSVGTHKLTIVYNDGECSTNFEIVKATANKPGTDTNAPSKETGDNSNLIIWFAVLFVSAISVFGIVMYGKRKKKFDSLT